MPKIVTVEQMHMLESEAVSCGVSYDHMMEMAGSAVFEHICARITDISSKSFVVVAGPGNNGGDGFVVARLLAASGASVNVFTINTYFFLQTLLNKNHMVLVEKNEKDLEIFYQKRIFC